MKARYDGLSVERNPLENEKLEAIRFQVNASTYVSDFQLLAQDLIYFDRTHSFKQDASEIDAFGKFWCLALADFAPGQVSIHRLGESIPLIGPHSLWIPPSSLIDWRLSAGTIEWSSYLSTLPLPADLPNSPMALSGLPAHKFSTADELFSFVRGCSPAFPIDKVEEPNSLAIRLREKLDESFSTHRTLHEIAVDLKVTHAAMTRAFRRCFGVSPVVYRNRKRVFEAMSLLLLKGQRPTETCFQVGFEDISRFNKQFRKQMNAIPSQYKPKKKNYLVN